MKLQLKKLHYYGVNNSKIFAELEVVYGFEGEMFTDVVMLNYNISKDEIFITVGARNMGVHLVVERMIEILKNISLKSVENGRYAEKIVKRLARKLDMTYEESIFESLN